MASSNFTEDAASAVPITPEMQHNLKQVASARTAMFKRNFDLVAVEDILKKGQPHWFLDLLRLWRPSGQPSGNDGLRLAVRDNYLNFYRLGQSIAKVSIAPNRTLKGKIHAKYFSEEARKNSIQAYGLMGELSVHGSAFPAAYDGVDTLRGWISVVDEHYAGHEKRLVDGLVARNDNVIDLEMTLPAWGLEKTAPRIDLVTIEKQKIVFWEVKTTDDSRIRAKAMPHVLNQLQNYRDFLEQDIHRERIVAAYLNAVRVMIGLRRIADQIDTPRPFGEEIVTASNADNLQVAHEAALVVLDDKPPNGARWRSWHDNGHAEKLKGLAKVTVQSVPGRLVLAEAV